MPRGSTPAGSCQCTSTRRAPRTGLPRYPGSQRPPRPRPPGPGSMPPLRRQPVTWRRAPACTASQCAAAAVAMGGVAAMAAASAGEQSRSVAAALTELELKPRRAGSLQDSRPPSSADAPGPLGHRPAPAQRACHAGFRRPVYSRSTRRLDSLRRASASRLYSAGSAASRASRAAAAAAAATTRQLTRCGLHRGRSASLQSRLPFLASLSFLSAPLPPFPPSLFPPSLPSLP
eukprot:COSAG02_NODE_1610_length_11681_cov_11.455103_2_plen_232_part_00